MSKRARHQRRRPVTAETILQGAEQAAAERAQRERLADPRLPAAVALLGRIGAQQTDIRYSEPDTPGDGPTVWLAIASYLLDPDGHPTDDPTGRPGWEAAAGHDPLDALLRLCEQTVDGGTCTGCGRPTVFVPDLEVVTADLLDAMGCVTRWDPELSTFRRSCGGRGPQTAEDQHA